MNESTKDLVIGRIKYQLIRLNPRDGSWVLSRLMPVLSSLMLSPNPEHQITDQELGLCITQAMSDLDEATFSSIQSKALNSCNLWEDVGGGPVASPLLMKDGSGRWATTQPDLLSVVALTTAVLAFNLMPFFAPGALETLRAVYPDLSKWSKEKDTPQPQLVAPAP